MNIDLTAPEKVQPRKPSVSPLGNGLVLDLSKIV